MAKNILSIKKLKGLKSLKKDIHYTVEIIDSFNYNKNKINAFTSFRPFKKPKITIINPFNFSSYIHEKVHLLQYYSFKFKLIHFLMLLRLKYRIKCEIEAYYVQSLYECKEFNIDDLKELFHNKHNELIEAIYQEMKDDLNDILEFH